MPPLVIGYGNPLRGDDGLGWHAAQLLAETLPPEAATVLTCHQLAPELAEPIARASLVVFVDARVGDEPGRIVVEPVTAGGIGGWSFSHHLTPAALLQLAEQLYDRRPPAHAVSVDAADLDDGQTLSARVAEALPTVVAQIQALLAGAAGPRD